uniref:Ovule protein n=1 Tax=Heterorhabditis bacteriophora TaxID=37862 RepID=A0A1I7XB04_HETBA
MDSFISSDASPSPVVSRYRPQRIIVNDDSSSSEYSYRASPLKERESFLSEDGIDMKTMRRTSVEENHEEWNELHSFIVSDEDDESSITIQSSILFIIF